MNRSTITVIATAVALVLGAALAAAAPTPPAASAPAAAGAPDAASAANAAAIATRAAARPPIISKPIPFGAKRKREMAAYARRHYAIDSYRLRRPRVIVEHYTVNDSVQATFNTFAPDVADVELHELPGVCSHFVVASNGQIFQFVSLSIMCRHTVGLNYTAIGIEHVGRSDQDVLGNARQLAASLRLTSWLRCRYEIGTKNVIGHSESLSSPYHRERVARLRTQTHGDMTRASMRVYRGKLGPC
jgi:N-acetylmuramoyl-L-alanine amidase